MTYVIRTRTRKLPDGGYHSTDYLMEMSKRDALALEASDEPGTEYNIIPATLAHRYVKQGMQHMTPLYIDDLGRVRYAKDSY